MNKRDVFLLLTMGVALSSNVILAIPQTRSFVEIEVVDASWPTYASCEDEYEICEFMKFLANEINHGDRVRFKDHVWTLDQFDNQHLRRDRRIDVLRYFIKEIDQTNATASARSNIRKIYVWALECLYRLNNGKDVIRENEENEIIDVENLGSKKSSFADLPVFDAEELLVRKKQ